MVDATRRAIFSRAWSNMSAAILPPRSPQERQFFARCTRCERCIKACDTGVLQRGYGDYPAVDFRRGECTFGYVCAEACPESLFLPRHVRCWNIAAVIEPHCLAYRAVERRRCQGCCDSAALAFHPAPGGMRQPRLEATRCSGCGACVARRPASAIKMEGRHGGYLAGM